MAYVQLYMKLDSYDTGQIKLTLVVDLYPLG